MSRAVHVFPVGVDREHTPSRWCWCGPELCEDGDVEPGDLPIYVHDEDEPSGKLWLCAIDDDDDEDDDD